MNWDIYVLTYISFLNFATFLFLTVTTIRLGLMYRVTSDAPTRATLLLYLSLAITWLHSVVVSSPLYQVALTRVDIEQVVPAGEVPFSYWYRAVSLTLLCVAIFYFDHVMRRGSDDY